MLSFRFDLTSNQINVLLSIYSGFYDCELTGKDVRQLSDEQHKVDTRRASHFITGAHALVAKGLVIHFDLRGDGNINHVGWRVTERGRQIALLILEDAIRIQKLCELAQKRGVA